MLIVIGSKNPAKVAAVHEFFLSHNDTQSLHFESQDVSSAVADQPMTLDETILGARNRALAVYSSFPSAVLAIGIEGGLTEVPYTHTGFMNICAAVIYDGISHFVGLSSGFEHPATAIKLVREKGLEIRDAYITAGLEKSEQFSTRGGAIGFMTDQKLSRQEYCMQAIQTAYAAYTKRMLLGRL